MGNKWFFFTLKDTSIHANFHMFGQCGLINVTYKSYENLIFSL